MDVKIITADYFHGRKKGTFGSSTIRGYWLEDAWNELNQWSHGENADVIIYQKVYWKWHMRDFEGIKILDICDPDWMTRDAGFDPVEISNLIDGITTSTEALAERLKKWTDIPVICIPDRVNTRLIRPREEHEETASQVVWYGYSFNGERIIPHILPSLAKRGLRLNILSEKEISIYNDYGVEIEQSPYEYETAHSLIKQSDFCLNPSLAGVNPSNKNKKFLYKSNNKTIIAWALGMPVAENINDMDRFMSPKERNEEIQNRREEIDEKWEIKHSVKEYKDLINKIWKTRGKK